MKCFEILKIKYANKVLSCQGLVSPVKSVLGSHFLHYLFHTCQIALKKTTDSENIISKLPPSQTTKYIIVHHLSFARVSSFDEKVKKKRSKLLRSQKIHTIWKVFRQKYNFLLSNINAFQL